jgi:hypothetical protein
MKGTNFKLFNMVWSDQSYYDSVLGKVYVGMDNRYEFLEDNKNPLLKYVLDGKTEESAIVFSNKVKRILDA